MPPPTPYAKAIRAQTLIGWSVGFTTETINVKGISGFGRLSGFFLGNVVLVLSECEIGFGKHRDVARGGLFICFFY